MPLGMEDRRILSGSIRASSSHNYNHGPERARLNIVNAHGRTGAWVAKYRNNKQWLQIDCGQLTVVKENLCNRPIGIQNARIIRNSAMKASSQWDKYHAPWLARLHRSRQGRPAGAWVSRHKNHNQWLQVYLGKTMKLIGINTQGRDDYDQWVTAYWILYSSEGTRFAYVRDWWDAIKTFPGNYDRKGVRTNSFDPPIYASYVRLNPRGWKSGIAIRMELYGCRWNKCDMPLGLEDDRVPDAKFRASSSASFYCAARNARLHQQRAGRNGGAWCARVSNRKQWLQVDFGTVTVVTKVCTQGRQNSDQWVTSYYLSFSSRGQKFVTYKEGRQTKVD
ncbi:PREDICTED: coagulation factor VIII-like [Acropora digitifera]|uniref:coagulation factor VIII-like n=1 Tax=Acropora digitifera TaxID=70779 RepID=UPI00077A782E|nr:PREDICTED: coagulation factor VIII-like [Acropora digitifera]